MLPVFITLIPKGLEDLGSSGAWVKGDASTIVDHLPALCRKDLCMLLLFVHLFSAPQNPKLSISQVVLCMMNGSISQFPEEKGQIQREPGACPRSWGGTSGAGVGPGAGGVGSHLVYPFLWAGPML